MCPKTTWRNYFKSEGLAGGDFLHNPITHPYHGL